MAPIYPFGGYAALPMVGMGGCPCPGWGWSSRGGGLALHVDDVGVLWLSVGPGWRGDGGWGRDGGIGWGGQGGMQWMGGALAVRWVLTGALSAVRGCRGGAPWWGPGAR